jgi:Tfp pilus assembly protein PilX
MYLRQALLHRRQALAGHPRSNQRGVVLLVALIILVALTLSGVALIRSVDTANLIAGNQSFHQSAVHAGETEHGSRHQRLAAAA